MAARAARAFPGTGHSASSERPARDWDDRGAGSAAFADRFLAVPADFLPSGRGRPIAAFCAVTDRLRRKSGALGPQWLKGLSIILAGPAPLLVGGARLASDV